MGRAASPEASLLACVWPSSPGPHVVLRTRASVASSPLLNSGPQ